ncbi:MAG TPA: glutamate racemase [Bacteroidales bacterium]|nr:glutamate racemase [Bacteroidales bacterium]
MTGKKSYRDIISASNKPGPIGVFDSGYGGLTILDEIRNELPKYDYLYLGDNARTPYGTRSFDVVYKFTLQCVEFLFSQGCHLVILACNTASAKALRSIQQNDLPNIDPSRRVLGVIRPTVEEVEQLTTSKHIGLFATPGTVLSNSYPLEIQKISPEISVVSEACPMWVPLIENNEHKDEGADYFVKKHVKNLMSKDSEIDTIILGCTHYPLLKDKIEQLLPDSVNVVSQGEIVAKSLADYLRRHPEMDIKCSKNGTTRYLTTENPGKFSSSASIFLDKDIQAENVEVE